MGRTLDEPMGTELHPDTEKDDLTVTIEGNGVSVGPIPMDELDQHRDEIAKAVGLADRLDEARERLQRQLTFDVGGKPPDLSTLKTTVDVVIPRQLRKGQQVHIAVTADDGELLAQTTGKVVAVTFEDEYKDGFIVGSERIHKVK